MPSFFREHRNGFWTAERKRSAYVGVFLLLVALMMHVIAGRYSAGQAIVSNPVGDLFLDNLPVVNLDFLVVGGDLAVFWIIPIFLFLRRPRYIPFALKAIAVFIIVRAFFTSLTHLGIYPNGAVPSNENLGYSFYRLVNFEGSLFFSGHTGYPFLLALILWEDRFWRKFFLLATLVFGAAVLLAHVHYSIDVFAAPFIVYGIYALTIRLFENDYNLSLRAPV